MKLRLIILLSILTLTTAAQTTNLKRTVLLTLAPSERVFYGEYFLAHSASARNFSCLLMDDVKKTSTFVFNGTRVKTVGLDSYDYPSIQIDYLNSTETNGYRYGYQVKDKTGKDKSYMSCFGENFGPYDNAQFYTPWKYVKPEGAEEIYFYYELGGRWYAKTKSKNILLAQGETYSSEINSRKTGPYDYKWINDNYHITYNGIVRNNEAYSSIWDFCSNGENFAFCYSEEGMDYLNINNEKFGPIRKIQNLETVDFVKVNFSYLADDGVWCFFDGENNLKTRFSASSNPSPSNEFWYEEYNSSFDVYSLDLNHSLISDYKYEYVVIDGESYGKSPAYQAWYDSAKNAFVWSAIEGKDLVVYEFKL
jgi:hypothetical protein